MKAGPIEVVYNMRTGSVQKNSGQHAEGYVWISGDCLSHCVMYYSINIVKPVFHVTALQCNSVISADCPSPSLPIIPSGVQTRLHTLFDCSMQEVRMRSGWFAQLGICVYQYSKHAHVSVWGMWGNNCLIPAQHVQAILSNRKPAWLIHFLSSTERIYVYAIRVLKWGILYVMATFIIKLLEVTQSHGSKESGMDHVHTTVTLQNNCCI